MQESTPGGQGQVKPPRSYAQVAQKTKDPSLSAQPLLCAIVPPADDIPSQTAPLSKPSTGEEDSAPQAPPDSNAPNGVAALSPTIAMTPTGAAQRGPHNHSGGAPPPRGPNYGAQDTRGGGGGY